MSFNVQNFVVYSYPISHHEHITEDSWILAPILSWSGVTSAPHSVLIPKFNDKSVFKLLPKYVESQQQNSCFHFDNHQNLTET